MQALELSSASNPIYPNKAEGADKNDGSLHSTLYSKNEIVTI